MPAARDLHHEQCAVRNVHRGHDPDPDERNSIASYRQFFANTAGFIVQSLAVPMVAWLGRGNDARGYQLPWGCCRLSA